MVYFLGGVPIIGILVFSAYGISLNIIRVSNLKNKHSPPSEKQSCEQALQGSMAQILGFAIPGLRWRSNAFDKNPGLRSISYAKPLNLEPKHTLRVQGLKQWSF